jgi:hypothetical protein
LGKRYFRFADGAPFFALGDTCTVTHGALSEANRVLYLDTRQAQGFNFLRIMVSSTFNTWTHAPFSDVPDTWPWGGSPRAPDYDRLNPAFFRRFERHLADLKARGLFAEIIVFNL